MTEEQLTNQVLDNTKDISSLKESMKSAHRRIDNSDRIVETIHKIAANVEALATQTKNIAERITILESKPGKRWESLVSQIITLAVAGVMGWVLARVFG